MTENVDGLLEAVRDTRKELIKHIEHLEMQFIKRAIPVSAPGLYEQEQDKFVEIDDEEQHHTAARDPRRLPRPSMVHRDGGNVQRWIDAQDPDKQEESMKIECLAGMPPGHEKDRNFSKRKRGQDDDLDGRRQPPPHFQYIHNTIETEGLPETIHDEVGWEEAEDSLAASTDDVSVAGSERSSSSTLASDDSALCRKLQQLQHQIEELQAENRTLAHERTQHKDRLERFENEVSIQRAREQSLLDNVSRLEDQITCLDERVGAIKDEQGGYSATWDASVDEVGRHIRAVSKGVSNKLDELDMEFSQRQRTTQQRMDEVVGRMSDFEHDTSKTLLEFKERLTAHCNLQQVQQVTKSDLSDIEHRLGDMVRHLSRNIWNAIGVLEARVSALEADASREVMTKMEAEISYLKKNLMTVEEVETHTTELLSNAFEFHVPRLLSQGLAARVAELFTQDAKDHVTDIVSQEVKAQIAEIMSNQAKASTEDDKRRQPLQD
ncbi:hypothetical protein BDV18DRAFT_128038 [Aspergillus unguis]